MKNFAWLRSRVGICVILLTLFGGGVSTSSIAADEEAAFPGAVGFGANTPGGRGGQVIKVTNLNATGPGSLAAA